MDNVDAAEVRASDSNGEFTARSFDARESESLDSSGLEIDDLRAIRNLRVVSLGLVAAVGILFLLAFGLLVHQTNSMDATAAVLNISGRQRMLVTRTALLAQLLDGSPAADRREWIQGELGRTITLLESSHSALETGRAEWNIPIPEADVSDLYRHGEQPLGWKLGAFIEASKRLAASSPVAPSWQEDLDSVTGAALGELLTNLDQAVSLYQGHNEAAMRRLLTHFGWESLGMSVTIIAAVFFVFLPMEGRIREQMTHMNRLRLARVERSETQVQLLLNRAPAVLWAADASGEITSLHAPEGGSENLPCSAGCLPEDCPLQGRCFEAAGSAGSGAAATEPRTFDFRCKGRYFHAAQSSLSTIFPGPPGTIGVALDVSELECANQEFAAAREIQQHLFPKKAPAVDGIELIAKTIPASAAAGDYYDALPLSSEHLGLVVGDVSGHGLGPALLMAETRAYLRSLARTDLNLAEILRRTSGALEADTQSNRFVTLFFGILDAKNRSLIYASAGHECGFLLDGKGEVRSKLPSTGLPLGMFPDNEYQLVQVADLNVADTLFVFSDGVCEATSPDGTEYGVDRPLSVIRQCYGDPLDSILGALEADIRAFCGMSPPKDDVTMMLATLVESRAA